MIHETALVHPGARLGNGVKVGPFALINDGVEIGNDSIIHSHCVIGSDAGKLIIGKRSLVRSHTVIYSGSVLGDDLETGHHATIRENTTCGLNFRIGSYSDCQGDSFFGDYVRLHSNVHIAKGTNVGNCVWFFPRSTTLNDPSPPSNFRLSSTIGDFSVISSGVIINPGVNVGINSLIGSGSLVTRDVPSNVLAFGNPARVIKSIEQVTLFDGTTYSPWVKNFKDGKSDLYLELWNKTSR